MADARSLVGEEAHLIVIHMDGMCVPDIVLYPVEGLHIGDRARAHVLKRVALLVQGLAEMSVQLDAVLPRNLRRLAHQVRGHGEG